MRELPKRWTIPKPWSNLVLPTYPFQILGTVVKYKDIPPMPKIPRPKKPKIGRRGRYVRSAANRTAVRAYFKAKQMDLTFHTDVSVLTLARIPKSQVETAIELVRGSWDRDQRPGNGRWIEPRPITGVLTYPLSVGVEVTVYPYSRRTPRRGRTTRKDMSLGYVLWCLAKAYVAIYRKHAAYGVWGHDLGDLTFSRIRLCGNRFDVTLSS